MAMKIKALKAFFILMTVQILVLQPSYISAANLKSVRSSRDTLSKTESMESNNDNILKQVKTLTHKRQEENIKNGGIDLMEGLNSTYIPSDAEDPWVQCPDGNYCEPNWKCCDADGDGRYNCCTISNVRNELKGFGIMLNDYAHFLFSYCDNNYQTPLLLFVGNMLPR